MEAGRSWGQKELEASGQSVCRTPQAAPPAQGLRPTALHTEKPQSGAVVGHPPPPGEVAPLITAFCDLLLLLKRPSQVTFLSRDNVDYSYG